jgi:hypothetical protein
MITERKIFIVFVPELKDNVTGNTSRKETLSYLRQPAQSLRN